MPATPPQRQRVLPPRLEHLRDRRDAGSDENTPPPRGVLLVLVVVVTSVGLAVNSFVVSRLTEAVRPIWECSNCG